MTFSLLFYKDVLEDDAKVMRQWRSGESKESYAEIKSGRNSKFPLLEQFFLTLVKLCLGLLEFNLANGFSLSQSTVFRITMTWINLCYIILFERVRTLSSMACSKKYMPLAFKEQVLDQ